MDPRVRVQLAGDDGERFFGDGPCLLLEELDRLGSLSAAARQLGMSYSKATRIVNRAEQELGFKLTRRRVGGEGGGSSELTENGRAFLDRYRVWRAAVQEAAERSFRACFAGVKGVPLPGCVVLAAGRSERFGSQKLLAPLGEAPVLWHTLDAVPRDRFELVVVAADPAVRDSVYGWAEERNATPTVVGPAGPDQSDSLRAGLEACASCSSATFVPGDQALIGRESLEAIADALAANPGSVVRLGWQGEGRNPVAFPAETFAALRGVQGDAGGSALLKARPDLAAGAVLVEAASSSELLDCDTPDALEAMASALGAS